MGRKKAPKPEVVAGVEDDFGFLDEVGD